MEKNAVRSNTHQLQFEQSPFFFKFGLPHKRQYHVGAFEHWDETPLLIRKTTAGFTYRRRRHDGDLLEVVHLGRIEYRSRGEQIHEPRVLVEKALVFRKKTKLTCELDDLKVSG